MDDIGQLVKDRGHLVRDRGSLVRDRGCSGPHSRLPAPFRRPRCRRRRGAAATATATRGASGPAAAPLQAFGRSVCPEGAVLHGGGHLPARPSRLGAGSGIYAVGRLDRPQPHRKVGGIVWLPELADLAKDGAHCGSLRLGRLRVVVVHRERHVREDEVQALLADGLTLSDEVLKWNLPYHVLNKRNTGPGATGPGVVV